MRFLSAVPARLSLNGLWHYLIVRAELRAALEMERERNRAFAAHREGLRGDDDTELVDFEDHDGRKLWITKNHARGSQPGVAPLPAVILDLGSMQIQPAGNSSSAGELGP